MNGISRMLRKARRAVAVTALLLGGSGLALAQGPGPFPAGRGPARHYDFGVRTHTSALADELWRTANAICWEMHERYQHNRGYRETYQEMHSALADAQHIHDMVHQGYHRQRRDRDDHITRDLLELDRRLNRIQRDLRGWVPDQRRPGRPGTQPLAQLVQSFDDTLHYLMEDYGVRRPVVRGPATPPPPPGAYRDNGPPRQYPR